MIRKKCECPVGCEEPAYAVVLEQFPLPPDGENGRWWYYACEDHAMDEFVMWSDVIPLSYLRSPVAGRSGREREDIL